VSQFSVGMIASGVDDTWQRQFTILVSKTGGDAIRCRWTSQPSEGVGAL